MNSYQHLYRHFLRARPGELHFAAHSHHWWPDVTRQAQLDCWDDAARWRDNKWQHLFAERIPKLQQLIAALIGSQTPEQLVFAASTHELVLRLLSCLPTRAPIRVLTSNSEFHSFERQIRRLEETGSYEIRRLACEPVTELADRLCKQLRQWRPELLYLSQVFFDSGLVVTDLPSIIDAAPAHTLIVIDGYHGFCALPISLSPILNRAFYLAGGYKYAQGGEGCCFMHVPPGCRYRPRNTGWFADFGCLDADSASERLPYPEDGRRFAGASFDPSGLYRLQAVLEMFRTEGLSTTRIHGHILALQARFLQQLAGLNHPQLNAATLIRIPHRIHGHFFSFRLTAASALALQQTLKHRGVIVDHRGDRLRIGFGLYQSAADVDQLIQRLAP